MTKDGKPVYCWDTSVFLAWINEEQDAPLSDIIQVAEEIDRNEAIMVVPVTVPTEIFTSTMTAEQKHKFSRFLKRSNVINATITFAIATKAREIREAGHAMKPVRKIKTPDAQIIATAIIYQCDALHSLDDRGSGPLKLNGMAAVDHLRIEKPIKFSGQKGLC
ncbi:MAG TPA: PIN domain-containing protein [Pirellulales bacterium]|nr:PIN domain-containing protein [Pirellulales bacterium]